MRKMPVLAAWAAGMLSVAGVRGAEAWNPASALQDSAGGVPVTLTGCGCGTACETSCAPVCETECDDGSGFFGGGELLFLRAHQSEGGLDSLDTDVGFRTWAGYQFGKRIGVQATYFDYNQNEASTGESVEWRSMDLQLTDKIETCLGWDLVIGGGVRYLHYQENVFGPDPFFDSFYGLGPVVSVQANRNLNDWLSVYAITDAALLYGDRPTNGIAHGTASALRIQLGTQARRRTEYGTVFARAGWESQNIDGISDTDSEVVGLTGGVISLGITR